MTIRKDKFDEREEDFYEALYKQSQAQYGNYVAAGTLVNNYAHIFGLLMRLRQSVNHPYLVVHSATANDSTVDNDNKTQSGVCGICHDPIEDYVESTCHHTFCRLCITEYMTDNDGLQVWLMQKMQNSEFYLSLAEAFFIAQVTCPVCQQPLSIALTENDKANTKSASLQRGRHSILKRIDLSKFQSSTKIEALCEELHRMMAADPSAKAIVFSQFTSMLELIEFRLQQVTNSNCTLNNTA